MPHLLMHAGEEESTGRCSRCCTDPNLEGRCPFGPLRKPAKRFLHSTLTWEPCGLGRDFKVETSMEVHSQKITAGPTLWIPASPQRAAVMPVVDPMIHLKHGRAPSMYTGIRLHSLKVQVPPAMVRKAAAHDGIRLAFEGTTLRNLNLVNKISPRP